MGKSSNYLLPPAPWKRKKEADEMRLVVEEGFWGKPFITTTTCPGRAGWEEGIVAYASSLKERIPVYTIEAGGGYDEWGRTCWFPCERDWWAKLSCFFCARAEYQAECEEGFTFNEAFVMLFLTFFAMDLLCFLVDNGDEEMMDALLFFGGWDDGWGMRKRKGGG